MLRENRPINTRYWTFEDADPEGARALARATHTMSMPSGPALATVADFSGVRRLLDVGDGSGGLSIALALPDPAVRCTVLDRLFPCAFAAELIAA